MLSDVGWEDRDWAKWSDEDRARFLSPDTGAFRSRDIVLLVLLLTAIATFGFAQFHGFQLVHMRPAPESPVVYGTGLAHWPGSSQQLTCTAMTTGTSGRQSCTSWSVIGPGQRAVPAVPLPAQTHCSSSKVDQQTGEWVCMDPAPNA